MFSLMPRSYRFMRVIFAALLSAFLLASCEGTVDVAYDVTIYSDNSYKSTILFGVPIENITLLGGTSEIENGLEEFAEDARNQGFTDVTWRRTDNRRDNVIEYEVRYTAPITLTGTRISWEKAPHKGSNAYEFEFFPTDNPFFYGNSL